MHSLSTTSDRRQTNVSTNTKTKKLSTESIGANLCSSSSSLSRLSKFGPPKSSSSPDLGGGAELNGLTFKGAAVAVGDEPESPSSLTSDSLAGELMEEDTTWAARRRLRVGTSLTSSVVASSLSCASSASSSSTSSVGDVVAEGRGDSSPHFASTVCTSVS